MVIGRCPGLSYPRHPHGQQQLWNQHNTGLPNVAQPFFPPCCPMLPNVAQPPTTQINNSNISGSTIGKPPGKVILNKYLRFSPKFGVAKTHIMYKFGASNKKIVFFFFFTKHNFGLTPSLLKFHKTFQDYTNIPSIDWLTDVLKNTIWCDRQREMWASHAYSLLVLILPWFGIWVIVFAYTHCICV